MLLHTVFENSRLAKKRDKTQDKCTDEANCALDNHGFHVHQDAPKRNADGTLDCASAGGHFAAESQQHARPSDPNR